MCEWWQRMTIRTWLHSYRVKKQRVEMAIQDKFALRHAVRLTLARPAQSPRNPSVPADGAVRAAAFPHAAAAGLGPTPQNSAPTIKSANCAFKVRPVLAFIFPLPLLFAPWLISAQSPQPVFALPVRCEVGTTCLIQKLVDHDPGPGRQDYRCGTLTTNGHDGIDIRLRTMADMNTGYAVTAAAAGQVLRTRDEEPDISSRVRTNLEGKDAGNAVIVDHGNGWQTQYSHLRRGSVAVHPGQRVAAGDRLGLVGMSGNAEFPHLHFTVRRQGDAVDPFVGSGPVEQCNAAARSIGLWTPAAARALNYMPTVAITSGLASSVPPKSVADRPMPPGLSGPKAPLLMWVDIIGAKEGDRQEFRITGPDGRPVYVQEVPVVGGGLSWFAFGGKRAPASGWPLGSYAGQYVLRRNGAIVTQTEANGIVR